MGWVFLFIFDNLSHKFSLRHNLVAYESIALHFGNTAAERRDELNMEDESIAWNDLLAELYIVDLHEVG